MHTDNSGLENCGGIANLAVKPGRGGGRYDEIGLYIKSAELRECMLAPHFRLDPLMVRQQVEAFFINPKFNAQISKV